MEEVCLSIDGQSFKVKKSVLCAHSDYFRAMFSGNYLENDQDEISIDVVDAKSMKILIQYMEIGLIDLFEYPLSTIGEIAMAANFLQITELIKQIEYTLELQVSISNWIEIMDISENASYTKLKQFCAAFGLLSFRNMKPEHIPTIHKLFWYLSHPYLDAGNELDVFQFGLQWISHSETGADALMIILGSLDVERLTTNDLIEIKKLVQDYDISLASKVVDCLLELSRTNMPLTESEISENRKSLTEKFTERVVSEVINLVKESKRRILSYVPTIPLWTTDEKKMPHYMFKFSVESGFEKWLEVAEKSLWGWSIVAWGPMRLVVACGEHGRGTGVFVKDIRVYDTLKKDWISHGVQLPSRRHAGLAIVGDWLFIVGGVGAYRVVQETALIYDLKQRTYRKIASLPEALQNPAVCSHEGNVFAAGHNTIYCYKDYGNTDKWIGCIGTNIRMSCMVSFNGYIYCTQNFFSNLYRFIPFVSERLELVCAFTNPPATVCNLGDRLLFFTREMCGLGDVRVEEFTGTEPYEKPKVVWSQSNSEVKHNEVAGSCSLVMSMPALDQEVSPYHEKYLMRYSD